MKTESMIVKFVLVTDGILFRLMGLEWLRKPAWVRSLSAATRYRFHKSNVTQDGSTQFK